MQRLSRAHACFWGLTAVATSAAVITPFLGPQHLGGMWTALAWWIIAVPRSHTRTRWAFHAAPLAFLAWPIGLWDSWATAGVPPMAVAVFAALATPLWPLLLRNTAWYARWENLVFPTQEHITEGIARAVAAAAWDHGIPPFPVVVARGQDHQLIVWGPEKSTSTPAHDAVLDATLAWLQHQQARHSLGIDVPRISPSGHRIDGTLLMIPALDESAHARLARAQLQGPYGRLTTPACSTGAQHA